MGNINRRVDYEQTDVAQRMHPTGVFLLKSTDVVKYCISAVTVSMNLIYVWPQRVTASEIVNRTAAVLAIAAPCSCRECIRLFNSPSFYITYSRTRVASARVLQAGASILWGPIFC